MPKAIGQSWAMPLHNLGSGVTTYTVKSSECGTLFTNTGALAACTVTLPTSSPQLNGWWCEFAQTAAYGYVITADPHDTLICHADLAADTFTPADTIGEHVRVVGTSWNEVQTLTLTGGLVTDKFKLSWGGNKTAFITCPVGGYANLTANDIADAMYSISTSSPGEFAVTKVTSTETYQISFLGKRAGTDVSAITLTDATGSAAGSIAETIKGGSGMFIVATPAHPSGETQVMAFGTIAS